MAYEKIVAVYDKAGKAKDAARALESSGFSAGDISLLNRDSLTDAEMREEGLWRRLFGRTVADHESTAYTRAVQGGGAVLTLRVLDSDVGRAMRILDVHNPVDVNDRVSTATSVPVTPVKTTVTQPVETYKVTGREEVLRLAEEQLDVGKRQVETGKARIRRFVIEKPVETKVTLHEEHTELLRRNVTDPTALRDVDWSDKTIEVTETAEQAVVTKSARVAEEVVIRKEGTDRVETVRDTVRRQQVEIERLPLRDRDRKVA